MKCVVVIYPLCFLYNFYQVLFYFKFFFILMLLMHERKKKLIKLKWKNMYKEKYDTTPLLELLKKL